MEAWSGLRACEKQRRGRRGVLLLCPATHCIAQQIHTEHHTAEEHSTKGAQARASTNRDLFLFLFSVCMFVGARTLMGVPQGTWGGGQRTA